MIIEETGERTAAFAKMILSPKLNSYLVTAKLGFRVVDRDVTDANGRVHADLAPYVKAVEGDELPVVLLLSKEGTIIRKTPSPTSAARLIALLKQYAKED